MEEDKELVKKYIENKKYVQASEILSKNIKKILVDKIKEIDSKYNYVNLLNLKNRCINLLNDEYISIVQEFCNLHIEEFSEEFEIVKLMELLKKLKDME